MIIFLGDSFTWGQGLYYKKWINEGKSLEYCAEHFPPKFTHENISHSDDEYRRKYHFPNLVSKHYNRSYFSKSSNGGSNKEILTILQNLNLVCSSESIDLVIVQFTEFTRWMMKYEHDLEFPRDLERDDIDDIFKEICQLQVKKIYNELKSKRNIKHFLFFSWRDDIGSIIKNEYSEHYFPLIYKDKEYDCFAELISKNSELDLCGDISVPDGHFSELGHQVIADSIIKKVDTMNIDFIRPK